MAVLYLAGAGLMMLVMNAEALPWALDRHGRAGAFTAQGGAAAAPSAPMIVGFQRAVFSNEAGIGSATIAHAAVRTARADHRRASSSLLEPFIDTVVICSATALVVITTTYYVPEFASGIGGIEMTSAAFERNVSWSAVSAGPWRPRSSRCRRWCRGPTTA